MMRGLRCDEHERYAYSFVEVSDVDKMPLVPGVREIRFPEGEQHRQLSPKTTFALAAKFPQAYGMRMQWYEPLPFAEFLQTMRHQLTESLRSARFPPTLANFDFQLDSSVRTTGDLSTSPNSQPDRLCEALHHAVNHISHLTFTGQVDSSLFWPYQPSETPKPFWQSMKTMEIVMDKDSTSSEWYLRYKYDMWSYEAIEYFGLQLPTRSTVLPPGHGSADEALLAYNYIKRMDWYENEVWGLTEYLIEMGQIQIASECDDKNDDEKVYSEKKEKEKIEKLKDSMMEFCEVNDSAIARLLDSMMKAMLQMPRLEFVRLSGFVSQAWAFEFYAPGIRSKHDSESESESPPAYPRFILPEYFWVPGKNILDSFRNMAKEKYGKEPVIVWVARRRLGH
ncbi:hypothetical protein N0V92_004700 [Colletotrichum tropicale]|nr:hypothetical protein N0V92_004700 [Colletotrichum tropicale]